MNFYFSVTTDATYGYATSFNITDVSLLAGTTANIPSNDNLAEAAPIASAGITNDVNTTYASKEPGEPNHAGNAGGHSVWWSWMAPAIGIVSINTTGSSFETLLAVYTQLPAQQPRVQQPHLCQFQQWRQSRQRPRLGDVQRLCRRAVLHCAGRL